MLTPEVDENTEKLTHHARQLINAEFRNLVWDDVSRKIQATQFQAPSPEPQSASKVSKTIAVKTARKKIRDEWDALKNATIISNDSPERQLSEVLRGVVAYIEINNVPKSIALTAILRNLGATVKETFTPVVTHVIFKRGSLDTFKRAKLLKVHLVSVLWIEACKNARKKIPEDMFPVPEHSDYTSPRTFRRFMEGLGSAERDKLVKRATRRTTCLPRPQDQRTTRSSAQSDSSESAIVLRVSTDDSGNKTTKQKGKTKKTDLKCQKPTSIQKTKDKIPNKRRLFGSGGDKRIDNGKLDAKTKRKLFTHNRLDDTSLGVSTLLDSSESSSGSEVRGVNPYHISGKTKTVRKKKVQSKDQKALKEVRRKENNAQSEDESTGSECDSPNSSVERRERVEEIVKMTQLQSETEKKRTKEKKRRLIKEKKKKLTKEERENFIKANKIARRQENQILKASQPRSCKKLNFNYSKEIQNPSLVSTFLHRTENQFLKECIDRLGGFTFKAVVGPDTTHVVCGGPVRTINLLKGLSRGCWLLDKRWAEDSMRAGHWLAEHDYELVKFSPAVQKCRIARQALGGDYRLDVFRRAGGVHVSGRCVARRHLRALLSLCGGALVSEPAGARVVVGERRDGSACVSEQWVLDSVAAGRCKSLGKYAIA